MESQTGLPKSNEAAAHTLALYQPETAISPEEIERKRKEAEELDKKLRYIVEEVPNKVYFVQGSQAGASSASFHNYRHSRRREQERLKLIDEEAERAEMEKERQERLKRLQEETEARTAKKRAKRQKKKEKQRHPVTQAPETEKLDGLTVGRDKRPQAGLDADGVP